MSYVPFAGQGSHAFASADRRRVAQLAERAGAGETARRKGVSPARARNGPEPNSAAWRRLPPLERFADPIQRCVQTGRYCLLGEALLSQTPDGFGGWAAFVVGCGFCQGCAERR